MNISEKIMRAKTDYDEVYDAGKNSIIKLHPETTVNGKYISVDDVSELPHNVVCQLSSDTLTDFSNVSVTVCGKNLLDESVIKKIVAAADGKTMNGWEFSGLVGTFTLSVGANWLSTKPLAYKVISVDGVFGDWITLDGREANRKRLITLNKGEKLIVYLYGSETVPNDTIQLEVGGYATGYEPYMETIYTPNADGTVEGIKSTSPYMNLFTNTDGVNIQATYRKNTRYRDGKQAEYDRFWDEYQKNGNRTTYQGAFAGEGWNSATLEPKYNFGSPTNCSSMFYSSGFVGDLAQYFEDLGITLDTSKATNLSSLFNTARNVTRIGVIDATSASTSTSVSIFVYCMALERIDKFIVTEATSMTGFTQCNSLTDITIEGTIGQNGSFKDSPLNKESITSVVTHLSGTITGKSMTFNKTAVDKAFETSEGALDGSTSAEWQALVVTKPNWAISLV